MKDKKNTPRPKRARGQRVSGGVFSRFISRVRRSKRLPAVLLALLAISIISWMATVAVNSSISVDTVTVPIPGLPSAFEGYTILHMSDLNGKRFEAEQSKLFETINGLSYNIVIMTGDMVGAAGDAAPLLELVDGLTAERPILIIPGDCDPPIFRETPSESGVLFSDYMVELLNRGVTYLDAPIALISGESRMWFTTNAHLNIDVNENLQTYQQLYDAHSTSDDPADIAALPFDQYNLSIATQLAQASKEMQKGDTHITISHVPLSDSFIKSTQSYSETPNHLLSPHLSLAGHYVAGQWQLPFYGALYVPDQRLANSGWFPDQSYVEGMRQLSSTTIYTSPGLSNSCAYQLPPFRLFTTPQLALIKLTSQLSDEPEA